MEETNRATKILTPQSDEMKPHIPVTYHQNWLPDYEVGCSTRYSAISRGPLSIDTCFTLSHCLLYKYYSRMNFALFQKLSQISSRYEMTEYGPRGTATGKQLLISSMCWLYIQTINKRLCNSFFFISCYHCMGAVTHFKLPMKWTS